MTRALSVPPAVVCSDEPTPGALDWAEAAQVLRLLRGGVNRDQQPPS